MSDPIKPSSNEPPILPYATPTPPSTKNKSHETLGMIVFFVAFAAVGITFITGGTWPSAASIAALGLVAVAMGHFITRH